VRSPLWTTEDWRKSMADRPFYLTVADHWSYIGLGWTLGVESVVESVDEVLAVADASGARFAIEFDARSYEKLEEHHPAVLRRLRRAVHAGQVEIVGASYSQPLASLISGESTVRQLLLGRAIVRRLFDIEVETFLHEEEFAHPQIPQLLVKAGYRFASMAQVDTWGRQGTPLLRHNAIWWEGIDGSAILTAPKNPLVIAEYEVDFDAVLGSSDFEELAREATPLLTLWEELGWDFVGSPMLGVDIPVGPQRLIDRYRALAETHGARYTTIGEYLRAYDAAAAPRVRLREDDWHRVLSWGIGGDQIRRLYRRTEGRLLAVEGLDALLASQPGSATEPLDLEVHWRDLLTGQSHDVAHCEYSVIQGAPPPLDRPESVWNRAWGQIGFDHLRAAERATLETTARLFESLDDRQCTDAASRSLIIFNPTARARDEVVEVSGLRAPEGARSAAIVDGESRSPVQLEPTDVDDEGRFLAGRALFRAGGVPGFGLRQFALAFDGGGALEAPVRVADGGCTLSNGILTVELDPDDGSIASLSRAGEAFNPFAGGAGLFFRGAHNPNYPLPGLFHRLRDPERTVVGEGTYDSRGHSCTIDVLEHGPVRCRVRVRHQWPLLMVELVLALSAGSDELAVFTRLTAHVPPANGFLTVDRATNFTSAVMAEFKEPMPLRGGYWLSWHLGFEPEAIARDLPFAADEPDAREFTGWSFVDARRADGAGLTVLHTATQYFTVDGAHLSNVLMREWESFWGNLYGWPVLAEYEHRLVPHASTPSLDELAARAQRLARPLLGAASAGTPVTPARGLVEVETGACEVSSLRRVGPSTIECRLVETAGRAGSAALAVAADAEELAEVTLEGRPTGRRLTRSDSASPFRLELGPWEVMTLRFSLAGR
jgi:hypothetical protein